MAILDDARKELHDFLGDMAALQPYVDAGNGDAAPFVAAFTAARARALKAATAFAEAVAKAG